MPQDANAEIQSTTILAWKVLYDKDCDFIPDPNKPEQVAVWSAVQKRKAEELEQFLQGPAKAMFDHLIEKIQRTNLAVLFDATIDKCNCEVCLKLRTIKHLLGSIHEMQIISEMNRKKKKEEQKNAR